MFHVRKEITNNLLQVHWEFLLTEVDGVGVRDWGVARVVSSHVSCQIVLLCEPVVAFTARPLLLTRMDAHVCVQRILLRETLLAHLLTKNVQYTN